MKQQKKELSEGYSLVIPTYNEPRIGSLLDKVNQLGNCKEIIIVDESSDNTRHLVLNWSINNNTDKKLRLYHRKEKENDLSQSILIGLKLATYPLVAVMDGDGQHPFKVVEAMYLLSEAVDLHETECVIASRSPPYHSSKKLNRELMTTIGIKLARIRIKVNAKDPLSGCFMLKSSLMKIRWGEFVGVRGYKLLFEILKSGLIVKTYEVPLKLQEREAGESKLTKKVQSHFIKQLIS